MSLSIRTEEADRLARQLANLTGESVTEAVTSALRERLERLETERRGNAERSVAAILETAAALRTRYDAQPLDKAERDALWGDA